MFHSQKRWRERSCRKRCCINELSTLSPDPEEEGVVDSELLLQVVPDGANDGRGGRWGTFQGWRK